MPTYTISTDQFLTTLTNLPALPAGTKLAIVQGMVVGWEAPSEATAQPAAVASSKPRRKHQDIPRNIALITQQRTLHPQSLKTYELTRSLQVPNGTLNSTIQHMLRHKMIQPAYAVVKNGKPAYILTPEQA